MSDLISRSALLQSSICAMGRVDSDLKFFLPVTEVREAITNAPAVDAVCGGVFDQVRWERDIAIGQLNDLGISLGCTAPDVVKVVRCKDCKHGKDHGLIGWVCCHAKHDLDIGSEYNEPEYFCSYGERKEK